MFAETQAFSAFAVDDLQAAKYFYSTTLGLNVSEVNGMLHLHIAGELSILVYHKPDHVPATYTILNFPVDDIDQAVDELIARGVRFERYDTPFMVADQRGVYRGAGPQIAWFTDPAGNILAVLQGE